MRHLALLLSILLLSIATFAQTYQSAESVEFDSNNNRWLVANGLNIIIDDGAGNKSVFGNGSASHGMEIVGNTLFAIDSNTIKGFDLISETEIMSLSIPGVSFLNGMASNGSSLYVTDFGANKVYAIDVSDTNNPIHTEIVSNTGGTPNGILYDTANNRLLFVTWGANAKIKAIDISNNQVSDIIATGLANIDRIVAFDNSYYISSWSPDRITKYDVNFTNATTVTTPTLDSPADIGVSDTGIMGIPMGNNVIFVDINETAGINDLIATSIDFKLSQNPVSTISYGEFLLKNPTNVEIEIFDILGRNIKTFENIKSNSGIQRFSIAANDFTSGIYLLNIKIGNASFTKKIIIK